MRLEQLEDLKDAVESGAWRPLMSLLTSVVESIEADVVKISGEDERKLVRARCQGEGARKALLAFEARINQLKKQP